jgi:hypothetical protein
MTTEGINFTEKSRLQLPAVSMEIAELRVLEPLTIYGIPEILTPELREVLQILVYRCITPMRPGLGMITTKKEKANEMPAL